MTIDRANYISKDKLRVRIETVREVVEGDVHVLFRHRASDLLNDESRFIPMTDAIVTPRDPEAKPSAIPFLALNKERIDYLVELPSP